MSQIRKSIYSYFKLNISLSVSVIFKLLFLCIVILIPINSYGEDKKETYTLTTSDVGSLKSEVSSQVEQSDYYGNTTIKKVEGVALPITGFSISLDDSLFTYQQADIVGVVSTPVTANPKSEAKMVQEGSLPLNGLMSSCFMQNDDELLNLFLSVSSDGIVDVYSVSNFRKRNYKAAPTKLVISNAGPEEEDSFDEIFFSKDATCFAITDKKGSVNLYRYDAEKRRYERNFIEYDPNINVLYIDFSTDGNYFLVFYGDSAVRIFSTETLEEVKKVYNTQISVPIIKFSPDGESLAFCPDKKTLAIQNKNNEMEFFIPMSFNIKDFEFVFDGNFLAVVTDNDDIYLFSAKDYSYAGVVKSYGTGKMTAWAFSRYGSYMLQGFDNGEIHKVKVLIMDSYGRALFGGEGTGSASVISPSEKNGLCFSFFGFFCADPFYGGGKISMEWSCGTLISPFYFGLSTDVALEHPDPEFPYIYYVDGNELKSPNCISAGLYAPLGVQLKFNNTPWEIGAEIDLGVRYIFLYGKTERFVMNSQVAYTLPCYAFDAGGYIFISVANFRLTAGVSWNYTLGFIPQVGLGYNIVFNRND